MKTIRTKMKMAVLADKVVLEVLEVLEHIQHMLDLFRCFTLDLDTLLLLLEFNYVKIISEAMLSVQVHLVNKVSLETILLVDLLPTVIPTIHKLVVQEDQEDQEVLVDLVDLVE